MWIPQRELLHHWEIQALREGKLKSVVLNLAEKPSPLGGSDSGNPLQENPQVCIHMPCCTTYYEVCGSLDAPPLVQG